MTYAPVLDGPFVGNSTRVPLTDLVKVPTWCMNAIGGVWLHHTVDVAAGGFRYAGTCAEVGHDEEDRLCGRWWGVGTGDAHRCAAFGPHDTHRCCCGAEEPRDA